MTDYSNRYNSDYSNRSNLPLPMGVVILCKECGNHADSYYWFMSQSHEAPLGACPNCLGDWREQAREIPLRYA